MYQRFHTFVILSIEMRKKMERCREIGGAWSKTGLNQLKIANKYLLQNLNF